jgi:hypothetical protein
MKSDMEQDLKLSREFWWAALNDEHDRFDDDELEKIRLLDERIKIGRRYVEHHADWSISGFENFIDVYYGLITGYYGEIRVVHSFEYPNSTGILPRPVPKAEIEIEGRHSTTGEPILFTFSHEDLIDEMQDRFDRDFAEAMRQQSEVTA